MNTAIFTICARNFLAYAMTLRDSVLAVEPGRPFYIFLADAIGDDGPELPPEVIPVSDLAIPDLLDMAFRYSLIEFSTSVKADCFLHLLNSMGFDAAIYLDPDIQVFAPLEDVHDALAAGKSAVLTPHLLKASQARQGGRDMDVLRSGAFNLGFAAFSRTEESLDFLHWWSEKLRQECISAPEKGLFVDQRFVDMAPGFIDELKVVRHPGYNVAYWNLHERRLQETAGGYMVDGRPLVFFHFSGVSPQEPNTLSKHLGAAQPAMGAALASLVRSYIEALNQRGQAQWSRLPYAYGWFANGLPILLPMRRQPPRLGGSEARFIAPDMEFWNSPDPDIIQTEGLLVTRLMGAYLRSRPDLMKLFPMSTPAGRRAYIGWFCRHGVKEYGIPSEFLPFAETKFIWPIEIGVRLRNFSRRLFTKDGPRI